MDKTRNDEQRVEHGIRRIHAAYLLAASMDVGAGTLCDSAFYETWLDRVHAKCDVDINVIDTALSKVWHTVLTMTRREVQERRGLMAYKPRVPDEAGSDIKDQIKALEVLCFELLAGSGDDIHINKSEIRIWEERIATWLQLTPDEQKYAHGVVWQTYMDAVCELGGVHLKPRESNDVPDNGSEALTSLSPDQDEECVEVPSHSREARLNGAGGGPHAARARIAERVAR